LRTGEYLTHETQSPWLLVSEVNLQSAKVFHNLMVLSAPDEIIYLLSGENEHVKTSLECPLNIYLVYPVLRSHNLKVLSHDPEIRKELSYERETSETKWLCPVRDLYGTP
jgi:hypothetical protein